MDFITSVAIAGVILIVGGLEGVKFLPATHTIIRKGKRACDKNYLFFSYISFRNKNPLFV